MQKSINIESLMSEYDDFVFFYENIEKLGEALTALPDLHINKQRLFIPIKFIAHINYCINSIIYLPSRNLINATQIIANKNDEGLAVFFDIKNDVKVTELISSNKLLFIQDQSLYTKIHMFIDYINELRKDFGHTTRQPQNEAEGLYIVYNSDGFALFKKDNQLEITQKKHLSTRLGDYEGFCNEYAKKWKYTDINKEINGSFNAFIKRFK